MPSRPRRGWLTALALALPLLGLGGATTLVALDAAVANAAAGGRKAIETIAVDDIAPGMKGYAVTVFQGTQTDRFEIEVIDIKRDFRTGQDAVYFRSSDPRLEHSGIVGGMSGSPIFIQGKLAGALAYGYRFNKDPIGAMTPISKMLEVDALPYRPDVLPRPKVRARRRAGSAAWADEILGLGTVPTPARRRPHEIPDSRGLTAGGLEQLEVPLALGGLSRQAASYLSHTLEMPVVQGASGGRTTPADPSKPKKVWKPGDSVSVVLIAGDNASAANGTVTWVGGRRGERLLAFGHPMQEMGPTRLPMADARVHVIIPSVQRSMKLASPLTIQGTMIQDRQPAIALRTDVDSPMIPVVTTVQGPDDKLAPRRYSSSIVDNTALTAPLAASLLINAITEAGSDAVEVTLMTRHKISLRTSRGPRTIELEEEIVFPEGVIGGAIARSRAVQLLVAASDNQFEIAEIREIEQDATLVYGAPNEEIERIRLVSDEVRAGDLLELDVELRTLRGDLRRQRISLRVPEHLGDQEIVVEIAGGDRVRPYRPMPADVDDLLDNLVAAYPARSLVATIYTGQEGISTAHGLISDLPKSVLEGLRTAGSTENPVRFKQASRRIIRSKKIIDGQKRLNVDILPPRKR